MYMTNPDSHMSAPEFEWNANETDYQNVMRASEPFPMPAELWAKLVKIVVAWDDEGDGNESRLVAQIVCEYASHLAQAKHTACKCNPEC